VSAWRRSASGAERIDQGRLADAGFAAHEHQLPLPPTGVGQQVSQPNQEGLALEQTHRRRSVALAPRDESGAVGSS